MDRKSPPLSAREVKRLRFWVRVFLIASIVGGFHHAWVGIYKRYNPDSPYVQAQRISNNPMAVTRHVRINGRDLWIPVPYLDSGISRELDQKAILLVTSYPEFEPL